jgi:hypothetical protein
VPRAITRSCSFHCRPDYIFTLSLRRWGASYFGCLLSISRKTGEQCPRHLALRYSFTSRYSVVRAFSSR